jgi:hypothetical protein
MASPFHDSVEGSVDALPLDKKLLENFFAVFRENVEALVAFVFLAPFADEQPLRFEPAKEGIESAFIDGHAMLGECFAEGVAVLFGAKLGEDSKDEAAASEFESNVFKEIGVESHTV